MADAFPREKLQPSLLDRLRDDLASSLTRLPERRAALDKELDAAQKRAFERLVADPRLDSRPRSPSDMAPFAELKAEAKDLIEDVLALELIRRAEHRRNVALSMTELRAAVLRDLAHLLNTEQAETLPLAEGGEMVPAFAGLPCCRDSVLNYGIPSLAGRVRTTADYAVLAQEVEAAIARFEPRIRGVRVRPEGHEADSAIRTPVTLVIEGELWGYPLPEQLRVRTVLDLEEGKAQVEGAEGAI